MHPERESRGIVIVRGKTVLEMSQQFVPYLEELSIREGEVK